MASFSPANGASGNTQSQIAGIYGHSATFEPLGQYVFMKEFAVFQVTALPTHVQSANGPLHLISLNVYLIDEGQVMPSPSQVFVFKQHYLYIEYLWICFGLFRS